MLPERTAGGPLDPIWRVATAVCGRDGRDVLVVFYSRTGTTAAVATALADTLSAATVERIRPTVSRRYVNWLVRSAVPGARVDVEPVAHDPRAYDAVFLGTPKWTLGCPPVTAYLDRVRFDGVPVGLFLTYGGFDERRYAAALSRRLRDRGATVAARLLVQRDRAGSLPEAALRRFRDAVVGGA